MRTHATADLIAYFGYDNTERQHSALEYQSPAAFETTVESLAGPSGGLPERRTGACPGIDRGTIAR